MREAGGLCTHGSLGRFVRSFLKAVLFYRVDIHSVEQGGGVWAAGEPIPHLTPARTHTPTTQHLDLLLTTYYLLLTTYP